RLTCASLYFAKSVPRRLHPDPPQLPARCLLHIARATDLRLNANRHLLGGPHSAYRHRRKRLLRGIDEPPKRYRARQTDEPVLIGLKRVHRDHVVSRVEVRNLFGSCAERSHLRRGGSVDVVRNRHRQQRPGIGRYEPLTRVRSRSRIREPAFIGEVASDQRAPGDFALLVEPDKREPARSKHRVAVGRTSDAVTMSVARPADLNRVTLLNDDDRALVWIVADDVRRFVVSGLSQIAERLNRL